MTDLQVVEQRLNAIERDVSFLAQMVGLVIVDQASRRDIARLAEMGTLDLLSPPPEPSEQTEDDLTTPARPA